ncbi:MAG: hypothetical protein F4090_06460 [Nitrospira sp. SB0672_bin_25]|nr:hypothetical protein [Nitrospira sp. SB0662_bin_26]MYF23800.1 hypothetical protein [Nitrospira sp. SB0678_bin_10]MYJ54527.1 hypothetical protein [Nitrospira sp. SB0672_bin_25]
MCLFPIPSWLFVVLLALGGLSADADAWGQATQAGSTTVQPRASDQSLASLITQYLAVEDRGRAQSLLQEILVHPRANLRHVNGLLRAGRTYEASPVGMLPSQPVRVRGKTFSYGLFVPPAYDPDVALPLVVCLHGAGFTGDSYLERWATRLGGWSILACPTTMAGTWWTRPSEELVLATIEAVRAHYRIDPDRIYLTGMSNGGIGAWIIGMHHAPRFAAVSPMASGIDDVLFPFLENLRHTSLYVIHGAADQIMPVWLSRNATNELARLGIAYTYREHEWTHPHAGGHFFPRQELPALVEWFRKQYRDPYPRSLTVVRDASHLTDFGWVRIDATDRIAMFSEQLIDQHGDLIKNHVYAKLAVDVRAGNHIEVNTERVRRYTLFLNDALINFSEPLTVVTDGRTSFQGTVTPRVETLLREARRRDVDRLFPAQLTIDVSP